VSNVIDMDSHLQGSIDNAKEADLSGKLSLELRESEAQFELVPLPGPVNPLGIGLHYGLSEDAYHRDPCIVPSLSASTCKTIVTRSAEHAHYFHPRLGGNVSAPKDIFDRGHLVHALLLGRGADFAVIEANDYKTKAAQEAKRQAHAEGKIPVLPHKALEAMRIVKQMRPRLEDLGVVIRGRTEVVAIWEEPSAEGVVLCRAMIDNLDLEGGFINDLKTTDGSAHPNECAKRMADMGTDIQAHANVSGLGILKPETLGRLKFRALYLEMEPPYCVTPVEPDGEMEQLGQMRWERGKAIWQRCIKSNNWPAYVTGVVRVSPPPWAMARELSA